MTTKSKWLRFAVALVVLMGLVCRLHRQWGNRKYRREPMQEARLKKKEPVALEVWILDRVGADAMAAARPV
jgi:hypothetical protein